jgi:peroxiredoxin
MSKAKRSGWIVALGGLVGVVLALGPVSCVGQVVGTELDDSVATELGQRYQTFWQATQKTLQQPEGEARRDSLVSYGNQLFRLYRRHPNSAPGSAAAVAAFFAWSEVGALQRMLRAHAQIPIDADVWANATDWLQYPYRNQGRKQEFIDSVRVWRERATSPKSRTHLAMYLGDHLQAQAQQAREDGKSERAEALLQEAATHYRTVSVLNSDTLVTNNRRLVELARRRYRTSRDPLTPGQPAPRFQATTLDSVSVRQADLEGQVTVLNFWATWCGPCIAKLPALKKLWATYGGRDDFAMYGVAVNEREKPLKRFLETRPLPWPQVWDDGRDALADSFRVVGVPRTIVLDRTGHIVATDVPTDRLEATVKDALRSE